ncbi:putative glyoxalase superfamily protein PhnB [Mycobacterium sp. BK086]|uniref:VOC family protein n=1 Tax=Mycobacterium sp. BK086 TaxID=2512165 RepID=UPI0010ED81CC|nr:VOC family protein [Mycobacterium sp. BK086]TDO18680.1 putative glyoxalase superfamily protein PhnB [Mycobacterium sp. BK086]
MSLTMPDGDWFANVEARQHPWPGLGWNTVGLVYDDVDAAVEFYAKALGMVPIAVLPDGDGQTFFARMRYRGTNITLNKPGWDSDLSQTTADSPPHFIFYLYVDDVRQAVASMEARGATVRMAAAQTPWGDLRARVQDPFGYLWDLAQRIDAPV